MRRFCNEEVPIYRQPDHGRVEAILSRCAGAGFVPGARHQQCNVLQMAVQVWRHGCLAHGKDEGARGREPTIEDAVCRCPNARHDRRRGPRKK